MLMTLKRLIKRLEVQKKDQRKRRRTKRKQRNGKTSRRRMSIQNIKNLYQQEVRRMKRRMKRKTETTTSTACIRVITLIQRTATSQERMSMVTNTIQRSSQPTLLFHLLVLPVPDH